jgi:hypothetical protein
MEARYGFTPIKQSRGRGFFPLEERQQKEIFKNKKKGGLL